MNPYGNAMGPHAEVMVTPSMGSHGDPMGTHGFPMGTMLVHDGLFLKRSDILNI